MFKEVFMFNIFEDMKWYQKWLFILAIPFIIVYELLQNWKADRKKK
jgi:ABC-type cobalamin transport system permease subunit